MLTHETNGEWLAWNPSTAQSFNIRDPFSPLHSVYMLVNQDNMWANVQKYDDPPRMNFNVSSSDWRPFYTRSVPEPGLPSVQPKSIHYEPVNTQEIKELKERLEITLCDVIMKWRSIQRTPWNRHAMAVLRKLVIHLEEPRASGKI